MSTDDGEQPVTLRQWLLRWRLDMPLLVGLLACCAIGLLVLYSASGRSMETVVDQFIRQIIGLAALIVIAQIPPAWFRTAAPWGYGLGMVLLVLVALFGETVNGAQRWLDLGFVQFQPSIMMKIAVPLTVAAYLHERQLPPSLTDLAIIFAILAFPVVLIARQPDLGTALLIIASGGFVVFLAGLRWRVMMTVVLTAVAAFPLVWFNLHEYQKQRILTFLHPSRDPTGAGYHIIQSKIAIGSGGLFGKGWLNSTQAHLNFLPASETDFIFAVFAEEWGFLGALALLALYGFLIGRGLLIGARSQDTFERLVAGGLSLTFFIYVFVNIGMVVGLMPVVGVPLPLLSYGGTSMVVVMSTFGIIMSIYTHRKLLTT